MWLLGLVMALHGLFILVSSIAGAIGYVLREKLSDAVGAMLTVGVAAMCEICFGCFLIF